MMPKTHKEFSLAIDEHIERHEPLSDELFLLGLNMGWLQAERDSDGHWHMFLMPAIYDVEITGTMVV